MQLLCLKSYLHALRRLESVNGNFNCFYNVDLLGDVMKVAVVDIFVRFLMYHTKIKHLSDVIAVIMSPVYWTPKE